MRHIHIVGKSYALALVPCGAVRMIIVNRNLPCVVSSRNRQFPTRIVCARKHIRQSLRPLLRRIPCLDQRVQTFVRRIAGDRPSVKMDTDQGLVQQRRFPYKRLLAFRKIDIRSVHAFSHSSHRTGAVLSAKRHDTQIRLFNQLKGFFVMTRIISGHRITIGISNLHVRHPFFQFLQQILTVWFDLPKYCIKFFRLI